MHGLQVAQHKSKGDCWIIVNDGVYDMSEFMSVHPGGAGLIMSVAGKDASEYFNELHKPAILDEVGAEYLIGQIGEVAKL